MLAALPAGSRGPPTTSTRIERDGQVRLWWDTHTGRRVPQHHRVPRRRSPAGPGWEPFAGDRRPVPLLPDLAVFKAFFDRTKDWADLEEMEAAGTLDLDRVVGVLVRYLGADDERVARLRTLET